MFPSLLSFHIIAQKDACGAINVCMAPYHLVHEGYAVVCTGVVFDQEYDTPIAVTELCTLSTTEDTSVHTSLTSPHSPRNELVQHRSVVPEGTMNYKALSHLTHIHRWHINALPRR